MEEEWKVDNMEKRSKHKLKRANKDEGSTGGVEEAENAGKSKAFKDTQISENEDVAEMKRHHKRCDKVKKKNKGTKDSESSMEPGTYGKDGNADAMHVVQRKEKKKKKKGEKSKDKDDIFEGSNVEEVECDKWLKGESYTEPRKESRSQKSILNNQDSEIEKESGKYVGSGTHAETCQVNDVQTVKKKKRKREGEKDKNDNHGETMLDLITSNDSVENRTGDNANSRKDLSETVDGEKEDFGKKAERRRKKRGRKESDEGNLSTLMQENLLESCEDNNQSTNQAEKEDFGNKAEGIKKKQGRKESDEGNLSTLMQENLPKSCEDNNQSTKHGGKELERKKRHKKKNNYEVDSSDAPPDSTKLQSNEVESANSGKEEKVKLVEGGFIAVSENDIEHAKKRKKKKKKTKLLENGVDETRGDEISVNKLKGKQIMPEENYSDDARDDSLKSATGGMKKLKKSVDDGSDDHTPQKSNKKVRFSGQDEVFPVPIDLNAGEKNDDADNLVRGKRFTHEEDEIIKEAVEKYIQEYDLGEEGLHMVLNSSKHPKLKGCWKEIGSAIPYRPYTAVYYRAQVLFRRSEHRKWTQEEYDEVLKYQEEHGNQWKQLAEELGKHRWHVKDTWRRIKLTNLKKGHWSQDEYQKLFDLVNYDLQLKALEEEKKSKHGMLRDNIPWTAISDKLSTRNQANCCIKWYNQLTSPMVSEGLWDDVDDYRLLGALYNLDATCMEDVDWDDLLDNRSADVCRKRWNQMVLHIGQHGNKSFADQVEVLAQRYCPHLLEAREAWDSKPKVT